jgi:hypothetical protein
VTEAEAAYVRQVLVQRQEKLQQRLQDREQAER